jgi:two-component system chemotaxis response regulator CheB
MASERIVVVGASAGGVEALSKLMDGLPADFAAPMVIVLHIPAESPSFLAQILARHSRLPVHTAEDGMQAVPGEVYVAPPDRHVVVEKGGTLRTPRGPRVNSHRPAVDPLFLSAADAYGRNAIGVVLTGTREDGTSGLLAIKQCGGIAIVQDPSEAAYPSMPQSAMEHVKVDHSVALHDLPELLVRELARETNYGGVLLEINEPV